MAKHLTRRMTCGVALALVISGCGGGSDDSDDGDAGAQPSPTVRSLTISFVHDARPFDNAGITRMNDTEGTACGTAGFTRSDASLVFMEPGAAVVVEDASGSTVGKGTLSAGVATDISPDPANTYTCTWVARIASVPDSDFYDVGIADEEIVTLSRDELERAGWDISVPVPS